MTMSPAGCGDPRVPRAGPPPVPAFRIGSIRWTPGVNSDAVLRTIGNAAAGYSPAALKAGGHVRAGTGAVVDDVVLVWCADAGPGRCTTTVVSAVMAVVTIAGVGSTVQVIHVGPGCRYCVSIATAAYGVHVRLSGAHGPVQCDDANVATLYERWPWPSIAATSSGAGWAAPVTAAGRFVCVTCGAEFDTDEELWEHGAVPRRQRLPLTVRWTMRGRGPPPARLNGGSLEAFGARGAAVLRRRLEDVARARARKRWKRRRREKHRVYPGGGGKGGTRCRRGAGARTGDRSTPNPRLKG